MSLTIIIPATPPRRPRALRRFGRDGRGATAVEFGLIAFPFIALLLALFQQGMYFFTSEALDAAVQNAARSVYTGQAQGTGVSSAASFVNTYLCPSNGGTQLSRLIDCSKVFVDVRPAPTQGSFSNIDTTADFYQSGSTTEFCPGGPGEIVIVRVIYPLPVYAPGLFPSGTVSNVPNNPGMKQLILGTAVFQNEPYSNGYVAPSGC